MCVRTELGPRGIPRLDGSWDKIQNELLLVKAVNELGQTFDPIGSKDWFCLTTALVMWDGSEKNIDGDRENKKDMKGTNGKKINPWYSFDRLSIFYLGRGLILFRPIEPFKAPIAIWYGPMWTGGNKQLRLRSGFCRVRSNPLFGGKWQVASIQMEPIHYSCNVSLNPTKKSKWSTSIIIHGVGESTLPPYLLGSTINFFHLSC